MCKRNDQKCTETTQFTTHVAINNYEQKKGSNYVVIL